MSVQVEKKITQKENAELDIRSMVKEIAEELRRRGEEVVVIPERGVVFGYSLEFKSIIGKYAYHIKYYGGGLDIATVEAHRKSIVLVKGNRPNSLREYTAIIYRD